MTHDAVIATSTSPHTVDELQSVPLDTEASLDATDTSHDVPQVNRDDAKLLFGNGQLDRWLSERRALHRRPKIKTLDSWLSPSMMMASVPARSPSVSRSRTASQEKSPVALRQKKSLTLESSSPPRSPSTDIRKYFSSRAALPPPVDSEQKLDLQVEDHVNNVTVIDLVEDSPPRMISERDVEASDRVTPTNSQTSVPVLEASCQQNSSTSYKTSDSEHILDWWATSRTKSATRKGPFKRSLGLVHFLNEAGVFVFAISGILFLFLCIHRQLDTGLTVYNHILKVCEHNILQTAFTKFTT